MKKIIFSTLVTIFTLANCFSQDIITKKTSEEINAKVIEVTTTEIKYKKFDNQNGPTYSLLKSDVLIIVYENGSKDIFNESQSTFITNNSTIDMAAKGKDDAKINYKGKKSGTFWIATSSIISPFIGIIPALACALSEPSEKNLKYRDPELMKNNTYNKAYIEEAHKIKKRKVWKCYGIVSGVWVIGISAILVQFSQQPSVN